jgi:hypothetical protein
VGCLVNKIPLNHQALLELDTNYGNDATNYVRIAKGMTDFAEAANEEVKKDKYLDLEGGSEATVTGSDHILTVTGHRVNGDAAQDFVFGKMFEYGDCRLTHVRITDPNGYVKTCVATIANIVPPSGAAGDKMAYGYELHMNGKPVPTPVTTAPALTATIADGSVSGTTKATITVGDGNTLGYLLTAGKPDSPNAHAYVSVLAYTSAEDIPAVIGQSLSLLELDANGRVVLFLTQVLTSGEIEA